MAVECGSQSQSSLTGVVDWAQVLQGCLYLLKLSALSPLRVGQEGVRDINEGEEDGGTWSKEVRKRRIWGDERKRGFLDRVGGSSKE